MSSILKLLLPENQPYEKIYNSLCDLLKNFNDKKLVIFIYELGN